MPLMYFSFCVTSVFEVQGLHFSIKILNCLHDRFLFKFVLFHHVLVGHNKISLCDQLKFNIFMRTFVYFTIVVLTWYDFKSYSIVLLMYISAQVFHTLSIYFRCIVFTSLLKLHIQVLA